MYRIRDLIEACEEFGPLHPFTHLVIRDPTGSTDPDDSFSSIPYEKGFSLLWHVQSLVGIAKFESFLKGEQQRFDRNSRPSELVRPPGPRSRAHSLDPRPRSGAR